MTLNLSKAQKQYLDKGGIMDATTLQAVFKKSVEDQEKIQKQAAKIRSKSRRQA
jgi:hypothetical protein